MIYTPPIPSSLPENWGHQGGGGGGTDNYNDLSNKPKLNDITLEGNKTASQLGLPDLKAIQAVTSIPSSASNGTTIMYTGANGAYLTGAVYRYQSGSWSMIMSPAEAASISSSDIDNLFE